MADCDLQRQTGESYRRAVERLGHADAHLARAAVAGISSSGGEAGMETPDHKGCPRNIAFVMVGMVVLAIVVIAALTITAIWSGPPAL
jgi:hypothetical protein